ncbi:MAG: site-specific integrase [Alphaproteobacteria bacterium]
MIDDYFEAPWALARLRVGCTGPYIDGFATALTDVGYSAHTIRKYIRVAAHVGRWSDRRRLAVASWDDTLLARFRRHLTQCRCVKHHKGVFDDAVAGTTQFLAHLRARGIVAAAPPARRTPRFAPVSERFADWMRRHRGVAPSTGQRYQRVLRPFLAALGEDPSTYTVARVRAFVIEQLGCIGRGATRSAVTAIRAFLRFLVAEGRVPSGIAHCVPTVPQWRLASLPRYLEAPDVQRVVSSCDLTTGQGLRDHAILQLLSRLGLRAGDIVRATLGDFDWRRGTLRVRGKGRREVLLPLPQDVGDAVLAYLEHGRPPSTSERVFLAMYAPTRPFASSARVSDIVRVALQRAGITDPPSRGAHLLRHSAATAMLRSGGALDTIATVLRHQSPDTTAYYAKADVGMLQQVAQPWPGGASC